MQPAFRYGGFWIRFVALLIDGIILGVAGGAIQHAAAGRFVSTLHRMRPDAPPEEALAAFGSMMGIWALSMLLSMVIGCILRRLFRHPPRRHSRQDGAWPQGRPPQWRSHRPGPRRRPLFRQSGSAA